MTVTGLLNSVLPDITWTIMHHPGYTNEAEPVIIMLEDMGKPYKLVEGPEYLASFPTLTDDEGSNIGVNVIEVLTGLSKIYGLTKNKQVIRACKDIKELWNEASNKENAQKFYDHGLEVCLDVLEGFKRPRGDYLFGNIPLAVDYYTFALVQLLEYIYGNQFVLDLITTKPNLSKWLNNMNQRSNITAYLERPRVFPIYSWQYQH